MTETCTIDIAYEGKKTTITLPKSAEYDDFIAVAMQIFNIHIRFKDYIQVVAKDRQDIVNKDHLNSLLFIIPEPDILFHIHIEVTVQNMLEFIYRFGPPKLKRKCIDDGFDYPPATRRRYA